MSRLICILAFVLVSIYDVTGRKAYAGTNADLLCGVWQNSKAQIRVEIYKKGQYYYGKVVWMKYPYRNGKPKTDWKNPDPSKRNRQVIGLIIMSGFVYEGNFVWEKGKVYDPDSGNNYSCRFHLTTRNSLEVRGYVGIALIGRTDTWTRVIK